MIRIYGSSDDLIEVEGDIVEEFNPSGDVSYGGVYVGTSTGALLKIRYDGDWYVKKIFGSGQVVPHDNGYSDVYEEFSGHVAWVVCGDGTRLTSTPG